MRETVHNVTTLPKKSSAKKILVVGAVALAAAVAAKVARSETFASKDETPDTTA